MFKIGEFDIMVSLIVPKIVFDLAIQTSFN